jgi:N-acyl-phosphatidylethanolamine-hydrolysing phospholipase D
MFRRTTKVLLATTALFPMSTVYAQGNKDHHDGNKFKNPWPSFVPFGFASIFKLMTTMDLSGTEKKIRSIDIPEKMQVNWDLINKKTEKLNDEITATWLGQ